MPTIFVDLQRIINNIGWIHFPETVTLIYFIKGELYITEQLQIKFSRFIDLF